MSRVNSISSDAATFDLGQLLRDYTASTPGKLQMFFGAVCIGAIIFFWSANSNISKLRQYTQTIGKDSVPSIIAAQEIRANLVDMDANAANAFLMSDNSAREALDTYEKERLIVCDRLILASQNITYGDEERAPIKNIVENFQIYSQLVAIARVKGATEGLNYLRDATKLMHEKLLPAAESLDAANFQHLDITYQDSCNNAIGLYIRLIGGAAIMLIALLLLQLFLALRLKRIINPPLAGATIVIVISLGILINSLNNVSDNLKAAKASAFDSIHALWKARSVAYDANGDESFYLLEPSNQDEYERSFRAKSAQLIDPPISDQAVAEAGAGRINFKGYLGDELRNITFAGESKAALDMLAAYNKYFALDGKIRELERAGHHKEAVELCIGTKAGQSNWAFDQFNNALGITLDINNKAFYELIDRSLDGVRWLPAIILCLLLVSIAMAWFGLKPRLAEYRG